jgi:hypothetical protein
MIFSVARWALGCWSFKRATEHLSVSSWTRLAVQEPAPLAHEGFALPQIFRRAVGRLHFVLDRVGKGGLDGHLAAAFSHFGAPGAKRAPEAMDSGDPANPRSRSDFVMAISEIGLHVMSPGKFKWQPVGRGKLRASSRGIAQGHDVSAPHLCSLCRNDPLAAHDLGPNCEPRFSRPAGGQNYELEAQTRSCGRKFPE